jgi:serine/threonine protein kinase
MAGRLDDHVQMREGTVINDKYTLDRLIGSGGMASVYQATHRNGHRVAIKMLHASLALDADLRARFLREGYVANKVEHPGAVRVIDDDTAEDGAVFLVVELLTGQTLDARWEAAGRRLRAREVCELSFQLLDVLAAAHAKGVIHRDIKPENLFLTTEGVLKVLDFGIARLREPSALGGHTRTGRMMGTPAFMPPEQALGRSKQIDGRTDLWAVGATMFTLVSGHFVHEAETVEEMLVHAGSRPARLVSSVAPELHPGVARIIDRALLFAQEERWQDAWAMGVSLSDAYRMAYGSSIPGLRRSLRPSAEPSAFSDTAAVVPLGTPVASSPAHRGVETVHGVSRTQSRRVGGSSMRRLGVPIAIMAGIVAIAAAVGLRSLRTPADGKPGRPQVDSASAGPLKGLTAVPSDQAAAAAQPAATAVTPPIVSSSPATTAVSQPAAAAPHRPKPNVASSPIGHSAAPSASVASATPTPTCRTITWKDENGEIHFSQKCQ